MKQGKLLEVMFLSLIVMCFIPKLRLLNLPPVLFMC